MCKMSTEEEEHVPRGGPEEEKKEEAKDAAVVAEAAPTNDDSNNEDDKKEAGETPPPPKVVEEKPEKKITDWPLRGITEPHENDVLYGRGGGTNHHPGNKRYRKMVEDRKLEYVNSKRLDKPLVALAIIREWRAQNPPGRFLKLNEKTGVWDDVGDKKAREKTSQALREKAPQIRKQLEEERNGKDDESDDDEDRSSDKDDEEVAKAILARDHSLGREYLDDGEAVTLDGFSWQDPFQNGKPRRSPTEPKIMKGPPPPPPMHAYQQARYAAGPPPDYRYGPPPPGAYPHPPPHMSGDVHHARYMPHGRYESWGNMYPPVPPPHMTGYPYPPPPPAPAHYSSGSWDASAGREHSLSHNVLPHAAVNQPAPHAFDGRSGGSWGMPPPGYPGYHYPVPPPPPHGPPPAIRQSSSHEYPSPSVSNGPPSPRFSIDPAVASAWSGKDPQEIAKSWSGSSGEEYDRYRAPERRMPMEVARSDNSRPDLVKRATSNQNETIETKPDLKGPSVKRAALNRDNSLASNRLKEQYVPGFKKKPEEFNADKEMKQLASNFEQSTLENDSRPVPLKREDRLSTIDQIAMDLMVDRPMSLNSMNRSSTIDALALDDLEDDPVVKPNIAERSRTMEEVFNELRGGLPKPSTINMGDRLTTKDFLDIVNEPLVEEDFDDNGKSKPAIASRDVSLSGWIEGV